MVKRTQYSKVSTERNERQGKVRDHMALSDLKNDKGSWRRTMTRRNEKKITRRSWKNTQETKKKGLGVVLPGSSVTEIEGSKEGGVNGNEIVGGGGSQEKTRRGTHPRDLKQRRPASSRRE